LTFFFVLWFYLLLNVFADCWQCCNGTEKFRVIELTFFTIVKESESSGKICQLKLTINTFQIKFSAGAILLARLSLWPLRLNFFSWHQCKFPDDFCWFSLFLKFWNLFFKRTNWHSHIWSTFPTDLNPLKYKIEINS